MKILHVSCGDSGGGAGRAAARLHRAERRAGTESCMLVTHRYTDDPHVERAPKPVRGRNAVSWQLEQRILRRAGDPRIERSLNLVPSGLHRVINASAADVVHLHWVNEGMLSIPEIGRISKPIVWTLHDMWPFAGAEHYTAEGDVRWREGYSLAGIDGWTWRRKRRHWRDLKPLVVAPSRWIGDCSRASALFQRYATRVIPNPIDPDELTPLNQATARDALGLPLDRRIVLFGALNAQHARKGFDLLKGALETLAIDADAAEMELIVFGASPPLSGMPVPTRAVGSIKRGLDRWYSAADVFVAPSRVDNLPNTVAEATWCGTPTVAFRVGGLPDLVDHRRTGYLAEPFDVRDFAAGIDWALSQPPDELRGAVCEKARMLAPDAIVPAYVDAYAAAVEQRHGRPPE